MESHSTPNDKMLYKSIPVFESLHEAVRDASRKQGISMYEAYEIAQRLYLKERGYMLPEIGEVSTEEKAFLEMALDLYRNRNSNRVYGDIINAMQSMSRVAARSKIY